MNRRRNNNGMRHVALDPGGTACHSPCRSQGTRAGAPRAVERRLHSFMQLFAATFSYTLGLNPPRPAASTPSGAARG